MFTYLTMLQRSALGLSALLFSFIFFVMPLAVQVYAQGASFPLVGGPQLKSVTAKFWLTNPDGTAISPPVVARGATFTVNWAASGNDGVSNTSEGITCKNNWGSSVGTIGSASGSIQDSRIFHIICMGLGAGYKFGGTVRVGVPDLISGQVSLVGLEPKGDGFAAKPYAAKVSVKNIGTAPNSAPFTVRIVAANNAAMTTGVTDAGTANFVGTIGVGATVVLPEVRRSANPSALNWYYRACADFGRVITELNEDNNCSTPVGPYKFVAP